MSALCSLYGTAPMNLACVPGAIVRREEENNIVDMHQARECREMEEGYPPLATIIFDRFQDF